MQNFDYSGVDPIRLAEAKRRVAVLEEYTQRLDPTRADTEKFAARLNLSTVQFNRLVRTWRDHRNPGLLVIGKRGTSTRDYGIAARAIEIAYHCIAAADADTTVDQIGAEIARQCSDENLRAPSRSTIWSYLRKARANTAVSADLGPPRLAIERIWARVPIIDMPITYMPTILVAVLLPERLIVAHDISIDREKPPSVSKVVTALARVRSKGSEQRPLLLSADDRRVATQALERAGLSKIRTHDRSILREMSNAFAGQLGPLELIHRRGMAKSAKRLGITRQETPLARQAAIDLINTAIETHNNAYKTQSVEFDIKPV
jgi:hypothetical protein